MGGLSYLLSVNPKVTIYAPKEAFGVYGADLPSAFYRKEPALPPEQRYYDGVPPEVMRFGSAWPGANIRLIDKTTEIAPGLHLIALVSDKPGTLELRELSLAIDTPDGMVIVVGCAHPGIDNIARAAAAINPRIHLIAGGLHLVVARDADIEAGDLQQRCAVRLRPGFGLQPHRVTVHRGSPPRSGRHCGGPRPPRTAAECPCGTPAGPAGSAGGRRTPAGCAADWAAGP